MHRTLRISTFSILNSFLFLVCTCIVTSCTSPKGKAVTEASENNSTNTYAENFLLEKKADHTLLTVRNPWRDAPKELAYRYVLYPRGQAQPSGYEGQQVTFIATPIQRAVCLSTTHIAMLADNGMHANIVGASNLQYIYNEDVQRLAQEGKIAEVGDGGSLNYEKLLSLKPDVVFAFALGNTDDLHERMAKLGLPVVMISEYTESTPLGRAEWTRFIAAFAEKEKEAQERFWKMAEDYEALKKMMVTKSQKPKVLFGLPDKGTWYVPGGKSFVAQLVSDAGGDYLWSENKDRGGSPLSFEAAYERALTAEVWLDVFGASKLSDITSIEPRLAKLPILQAGNVYNYTKRISKGGGYDIFEGGAMSPHRILEDFARILHPEDFPENKDFYFYERLPR